jgi:peptide chain release factor 1
MIPVDKLESLARRFRELDDLLCVPEILADRNKLQKLTKERTELDPVVQSFDRWKTVGKQLADAEAMLADPDMRELAELELADLKPERERLEAAIQLQLLPQDPNDAKNTILEIRSGEGGEEAALFAADIFRMYAKYAETKRWTVEVLSLSEAAAGGYKECIALVTGANVYSVFPRRRPRAASTPPLRRLRCCPRRTTSTCTWTKKTSRSASPRAVVPAVKASTRRTARCRSCTSPRAFS